MGDSIQDKKLYKSGTDRKIYGCVVELPSLWELMRLRFVWHGAF